VIETVKRTNGILLPLSIRGADEGPLAGLNFVAKDLFDIEGYATGAGNPDWLRTHEVANRNAVVVDQLMNAGATLVGKSVTDELAYSLDGINVHYGAPENPQHPGRVSGGSSSGSASAVAAGLADFAIGTDTAGSVRLPASFCGTFGFRPTYDAVSLRGVVPLAPIFDTVGWFARSAELLKNCGTVLLKQPGEKGPSPFKKLLVAIDAFQFIEPELGAALAEALPFIKTHFQAAEAIQLAAYEWDEFVMCFRLLQSFSAWETHGAWIKREHPQFDPSIEERFEFASRVTLEQKKDAEKIRNRILENFAKLLPSDAVLVVPTTQNVPPFVNAFPHIFMQERMANLKLTVVSPLAKLPQVTIPVKYNLTQTTGLSFIAAQNQDMALLTLAETIAGTIEKFERLKFVDNSPPEQNSDPEQTPEHEQVSS
jgi:amidase